MASRQRAQSIASVRAATSAKLGIQIADKVGAGPLHVTRLRPKAPPQTRLRRLATMLLAEPGEARTAARLAIIDDLRRDLPRLLAKSPLKAQHMGFDSADDMIRYLDEALDNMRTRAGSVDNFARGIGGWRWNFAGRLLFERLVKYHPGLDAFFRENARVFLGLINDDIRTGRGRGQGRGLVMHNANGEAIGVTRPFDAPQKVLEFRLVGSDDVERAFSDFGFLASNSEGLWALMPIEIKMPSALAGVGKQFSEFLPRLAEAKKLTAVVADGKGRSHTVPITDPRKIVVAEHDLGQQAVAPLGVKRLQQAYPNGVIPPDKVGMVETIDLATSPTRGVIYYKIRIAVERDWLVDIVRLISG